MKRNFETVYTTRRLRVLKDEAEIQSEFLYSKGRYLTRIRECELPDYFVETELNDVTAFMDPSKIADIVFVPSEGSSFEKDRVDVSYGRTSKDKYSIYGYDLIAFLYAVKVYSSMNLGGVLKDVRDRISLLEGCNNEWEHLSGAFTELFGM